MKQLKVLLFNGSTNKKGNSEEVLVYASDRLKENGVAPEIFWMSADPFFDVFAGQPFHSVIIAAIIVLGGFGRIGGLFLIHGEDLIERALAEEVDRPEAARIGLVSAAVLILDLVEIMEHRPGFAKIMPRDDRVPRRIVIVEVDRAVGARSPEPRH